jgi:DNA polymerase-1
MIQTSLNFSSEQTTNREPLLILIDGHSLAFRAYYALGKSRKGPLLTSTGIPTSICFGFLNSLIQVIEAQNPQLVVIAFDRGKDTFRHKADLNYKANRQETPDDFITDLHNLQELLRALNVKIVTAQGYEADDVIGTLANRANQEGYRVKILSGDRDLFQLVNPERTVSVLYLDNRAIKSSDKASYPEFYPPEVSEKLGILPGQIVDYKALCGDKSDNIPGIRGIGEKTAVKLLNEYGSLENIYKNIDKFKGTLKTRLIEGKKDALHSQHLAQLVLDAPLNVSWEDCRLQGFKLPEIKPLLEKLELRTFLEKIDHLQEKLGGNPATHREVEGAQLSLFNDFETWAIEPRIIDTKEKLGELISILKNCTNSRQPVAWDTETTSLNTRDAQLVGIGCCWGNNPTEMAYIPLNHTEGENLDGNWVLDSLRFILEGQEYPKVFQNTKFDRLVLLNHGINLNGVVFDTMLASYVLSPEQSHKLGNLCLKYLPSIRAKDYDELGIPKGKTIADLDIVTTANYCGLDAYATFLLVPKLWQELEAIPELSELMFKIELPLEAVLADMEYLGVKIDSQYLSQLSQQLEESLGKIEQEVYDYAGEKFNLGSPKQLGEILFEKMGLNKRKTRKTKTGYSTDHATLEKLQGDHPIIDKILEYRTLAKLRSTYTDALPALVRPDTQRIHTDFNQTVTATGRLSSSNPNLQNIPIRTEYSRQIRKAFIAEKDHLLISADYSQIELRILAHLSGEPVLIEAYNTGEDVHSITAKLLFDKDTVTAEERRLGKTINFGVIYGMGSQKFAKETGISAELGREFINKYRHKYSKVFEYLENTKKRAIAQGYVSTILGRRRYFNFTTQEVNQLRGREPKAINLDELKLNNIDAQLLRGAANAPIQGSSADIIKIAMIQIHKILQNYQAKLILQVHDELVFEVPTQELEELQSKIKSTMENAVKLTVPLVVEVSYGKNWMDTK